MPQGPREHWEWEEHAQRLEKEYAQLLKAQLEAAEARGRELTAKRDRGETQSPVEVEEEERLCMETNRQLTMAHREVTEARGRAQASKALFDERRELSHKLSKSRRLQ